MKKTLTDVLLKTQKRKNHYFENWQSYSKKIKEIAKEKLGKVEVIVFGSIIENKWGPSSDIDILIIPKVLPKDFEKRAQIRTKIKSQVGPFSPFQIHLATPEEYKNWYSHFIKKQKIKV